MGISLFIGPRNPTGEQHQNIHKDTQCLGYTHKKINTTIMRVVLDKIPPRYIFQI